MKLQASILALGITMTAAVTYVQINPSAPALLTSTSLSHSSTNALHTTGSSLKVVKAVKASSATKPQLTGAARNGDD
jgi:uncharacterized membrane protein YedE/YeeE